MKKLTLEEFLRLMYIAQHNKFLYPSMRVGQVISNALCEINLTLYQDLVKKHIDCFYQDSKIIHFIDAILEK